jgi:glucokinase
MAKKATTLKTHCHSCGSRQRDLMTEIDAREVLCLLREHDFDSRSEIERLSGLSSSRVSAAVALLIKKGLVESLVQSKSKGGRRSGLLRINAGYGHVIGVDIGGSNLRIALADMNGTVLGKWSTSTKRTSSPDMVVEQIRKGVKYLLQQTSVPARSLVAVAAGAPGITDGDAGVVLATSYLKGWKDVPLRRLLESALRIPAAVENDVKIAAIGENWLGAARGIRNFVFLAIGTGIAAGIFVNGQLLHGTEWAAGEVGYMIVPGTPETAAKRGTPGSLESVLGGDGIQEQWWHSRNRRRAPLPPELSATEIFESVQTGDRLAQSVLERSARILAYAVYNISVVLNCSLFVLGGGVGMSAALCGAAQRILDQYSEPACPKLTISSLGPDAQLIGAIRLALLTAESRIWSQDVRRGAGPSRLAPSHPS